MMMVMYHSDIGGNGLLEQGLRGSDCIRLYKCAYRHFFSLFDHLNMKHRVNYRTRGRFTILERGGGV